MADSYRTDGSHALNAASASHRDAKIEELLLVGLDHYFAAQYEQAINVWTRALFLDRSHARARAYIERARSALAERQRRSEELLQNGVAAFQRGDGGEARRLLRAAIDEGAPADEALTVLSRLDRLEQVEAPLPSARSESIRREHSTRRSPVADAAPQPAGGSRGRVAVVLVGGVLLALAAIGGAMVSTWTGWRWPSPFTASSASTPATVAPRARAVDLPVPRRAERLLDRARALAAGGELHDALATLDRIRFTDAERVEADRLRIQIQRELLAMVPDPGLPLPSASAPSVSAPSVSSPSTP